SNKDNGDKSYARLGFKGETQITEQLAGYGQWEYEFKANRAEGDGATSGDKTRLGFAGLKFGEFGSFDYGRNYGVLYDVEAWTDMLQYQGKNSSDTNNARKDLSTQNGDGYGLSTTYDFGMGISAGAAYASSDRTNDQVKYSSAGGDKADAWTTGLKYDANNIYLAAMYAETRNMTPYGNVTGAIANKTQNFEVTAQYQFDFGLRPEVSYLQSKGKDLAYAGKSDVSKDLVKYVSVGTSYYFNKNMSTYVDYKINLLDNGDKFYENNGISTDDIVAVGLVYQF
ncbi:MAG: porin, partial [Hafnia sp.]